MNQYFAGIYFAMLAIAPAALAEEHRQLGAHEHGHGKLNIAIEGNIVTMELEAPGADIAGFEHEATTPEQKAVLEKTAAQLAKPLDLFKVPGAAGCTAKDAKVAIQAEDHDDDDHDGDHDHDASHQEGTKGSGNKAEHEAGHEAGHEGHEHHHSAYHVTYALTCAKPENLAAIDFDYFKAFSGARALTVNIITSKAQSSFEVAREKPHLDLNGLI